ncbi:Clavaminate synthase-like protein At3g21360 [Linum grandiflorum]
MAIHFQEAQIPHQKHFPNSPPFPAVLTPSPSSSSSLTNFTSAIKSETQYLESLLHESGAILFRGFPLSTASDFNQFVESLGFPDCSYVGGSASRTRVVGRVFTANESPPDQQIPFHHELAHVRDPPTKLIFFCEEEPRSGGETPVVLSHLVYERMTEEFPEFVKKLEDEGQIGIRFLGADDDVSSAIGRGWKSTFSTDDKLVAKQRAEALGMKLEWITDDVDGGGKTVAKTTTGPMPAIKFDKSRNRKVWFNALAASYTAFGDKRNDPAKSVTFGSGDAFPRDAMYGCLKIMEELSVAIPWQKGDVLLIDNFAVLHSRNLFTPPRRVLAALCK